MLQGNQSTKPGGDRYLATFGAIAGLGILLPMLLVIAVVVTKLLWPFLAMAMFLAIIIPLSTRWMARNTLYTCSGCGNQFQLSPARTLLTFGIGLRKYLRCRGCHKRCWCDMTPAE